METKLQTVIKESGLTGNKVQELLANFGKDFQEAQKIANDPKSQIIVTSEDQLEEMSQAREQRLALKNIRSRVENTRKELKEQSLREGKAIDGAANIIKALIVPVEEHLEKQEKFVELAQAKKRAEKIQARIEELSKYVPDISVYKLDEMSNETYEKLLATAKQAYLDQQKAEKKAEEERIAKEKADLEERKRIEEENKKLRLEAEVKERELKKEQLARETAERKVREEKAMAERVKREQEEKLAKQKADEEEKKRQAELAPDKEKMRQVYRDLSDIANRIAAQSFTSKEAQSVADNLCSDLKIAMTKLVDKMRKL